MTPSTVLRSDKNLNDVAARLPFGSVPINGRKSTISDSSGRDPISGQRARFNGAGKIKSGSGSNQTAADNANITLFYFFR